jgi:hypothetical protein
MDQRFRHLARLHTAQLIHGSNGRLQREPTNERRVSWHDEEEWEPRLSGGVAAGLGVSRSLPIITSTGLLVLTLRQFQEFRC